MPSPSLVAKSRMETAPRSPGERHRRPSTRSFATVSSSIARSPAGLGKLSIETSNDLFEMDPRVTPEEVHDFRSKRGEWVKRFDAALRELFETAFGGQRRKGRRPDPVQSLSSLRVMNDSDTSSQRALATAIETPGGGGEAGARCARLSRIGAARRAAGPRGRQSVLARLSARRDRHDLAFALRRAAHVAAADGARGRRLHAGDQQDLYPAQPIPGRARDLA